MRSDYARFGIGLHGHGGNGGDQAFSLRQRGEVVRPHVTQQVSGGDVLEHASTLKAATDTNSLR